MFDCHEMIYNVNDDMFIFLQSNATHMELTQGGPVMPYDT